MGVLSGALGAVNGQHTLRDWNISSSEDLQAFVASNTLGGTGRRAGVKDWRGGFNLYQSGNTGQSLGAVKPGTAFTFTGSMDNIKGVVGPAMVSQLQVTIDIEGGRIIMAQVSFEGNGTLVKGPAVAADATIPNPDSSMGCKVQLGTVVAAPVFTELTHVRTVTLTFSSALQAYSDSSTAGFTLRKAGPLDAQVSISVYPDGDLSLLPQEGDIKALKVFIDADDFWLLNWVRFGEMSDVTVSRETHAVIGATLNAGWSCAENVDGTTPTMGKIQFPDDSFMFGS